jgi:serpin B
MSARWVKARSLFLFVLLTLSVVGCSAPADLPDLKPGEIKTADYDPAETKEPDARGSNGKIAAAEVQRETPLFADQSLFDQQVAANNDFAFDLYRSLRPDDGNLFYSPYSISIAVAMAYAGARHETEKQMSETLHYILPQDQLHQVFNLLDQSLNASGGDELSFQLDVVNSLWGQDGFPFLPDFLTLIARNYGAGVRLVDFTYDTNREAARRTINDWVSQQTNDKIKELLPKEMLTDMTRLILVNAIYFKGEWQDYFENGTADAPFTFLDGQEVSVPTMSRRAVTPYLQGDGYQVIRLPYKGGRAEMIIMLPDPGKFSEFEQTLDQESFDRILAELNDSDVKLYMPKFQFEYSKDMKDTLKGMGMPAAFDPLQADFSGIYDRKIESRNLFISHIAHKAFVSVDEKGTEAAAATGVVAEIESMPVMLRIDHPFIFVIRDRQTGSILFLGRVLDPRTP